MFSILALAAAAQLVAPAASSVGPISTLSAPCGQPSSNQKLTEPPVLRSQSGLLSLTLRLVGSRDPGPGQKMCYVYRTQTVHGPVEVAAAPTLHLKQGDQLVLTLVNELLKPDDASHAALTISSAARPATSDMAMGGMTENTLACGQPQTAPVPTPDPATGRIYGYHRSPYNELNLHFHGLNTSPLPPGDDIVDVLLCPRSSASQPPNTFTYVVSIPRDEPAGMYWYHPHVHGNSEYQVLKGLTGAIVVDTFAPSEPDVLPNRILIVRDFEVPESASAVSAARRSAKRALRLSLPTLPQIRDRIAREGYPRSALFDSRYPFGPPDQCESPPPPPPVDSSKGLTVNGLTVPSNPNSLNGVPYTTMTYGQTQYWRLANTASDTVLDLELLTGGRVVPLLVTSRDGVPIVNIAGHPTWQPIALSHVLLTPGARVEFYVTAAVPNAKMVLRTRKIDTGCVGDDDLARNLVVIEVGSQRAAGTVRLPATADAVAQRFASLAKAQSVRQRVFAFTEYQRSDEGEPDFYITELSNPKAVEHPFSMSEPPDVIVKDGTVETWTILNYTQEVHAFHIHQIHFLVQRGAGIEDGQGQLLDTVNVPYGVFKPGGTTGAQMTPGAVTLRMDFRDKNIIGTFVYHCHILEHEDNGMMAKIRVIP